MLTSSELLSANASGLSNTALKLQDLVSRFRLETAAGKDPCGRGALSQADRRLPPSPRIASRLQVSTHRNPEHIMNKSELIQTLAEKIKISDDEASLIVDSFFDSMRDAMLHGDRIEIRGFGSFKIKQYESYVGRNPKTGELVQVKPKKMPLFKAGKGLLDDLNS
jgi:integration host factor subunit beta